MPSSARIAAAEYLQGFFVKFYQKRTWRQAPACIGSATEIKQVLDAQVEALKNGLPAPRVTLSKQQRKQVAKALRRDGRRLKLGNDLESDGWLVLDKGRQLLEHIQALSRDAFLAMAAAVLIWL